MSSTVGLLTGEESATASNMSTTSPLPTTRDGTANDDPLGMMVVVAASASAFIGTLCDIVLCLIIISRCRSPGLKPSDVYILNVVIAGVLLSSIYMPSTVAVNVLETNLFGREGCFFLIWLLSTTIGVMLLSHTALSVHWMLLTFSKDMKLMRRRGVVVAAVASAACWIAMSGTSMACSRQASFVYDVHFYCSHREFDLLMLVPLWVVGVPSQLLTPIGYALTFVRVGRHRKPLMKAADRSFAAADSQKKEYRLIKTIFAIFIAVEGLCGSSLMLLFVSRNVAARSAAFTLLYMSNLVNGPLLLAVNRDYRETLLGAFRRPTSLTV